MTTNVWSPELDCEMIGLYAEGYTRDEIAEMMGIGRGSVSGRMWRLRERGVIKGRARRRPGFKPKVRTTPRAERAHPTAAAPDGVDRHVERCLALGGFPTAVVGRGWLNMHGRRWIEGRAIEEVMQ